MRRTSTHRHPFAAPVAALVALALLATLLVVGPGGPAQPAGADPWDVVELGQFDTPYVEVPFSIIERDQRLKPEGVDPDTVGYRCQYEAWISVDFTELARRGADVDAIAGSSAARQVRRVTDPSSSLVSLGRGETSNPPPPGWVYVDGSNGVLPAGHRSYLYAVEINDVQGGPCDVDENHLYDDEGELHSTRVRQELARTRLYTQKANFPGLVTTIEYVGRPQEGSVAWDEDLRVRVTVRPSPFDPQGVTDIALAAPDGPLLEVPELFDVVTEPSAADLAAIDDLDAGDEVTFDWVLRPNAGGPFTLRTTELVGTDSQGDEVRSRPATKNGAVSGLAVEVTADPDRFNLGANDHDDLTTVTVRIRNLTEDDLTGVTLQGPLDWGPAPGSTTLEVGLRFADPDAVAEQFGNAEVVELGALAAGDEVTFTYELEAFLHADAELRQLITTTGVGGQSNALATGRLVVVDDPIVEVGVRAQSQSLVSGQPVRLEGVVRNVTDDEDDPEAGTDVAVAFWPMTEGNAGNGFLVDATAFEGAATPTAPSVIHLAPGEEVDLGGLLATVEAPTASQAKVRYHVAAATIDDEGQPREIGSDQVGPAEGYPADPEVTVTLAAADLAVVGAGESCGEFSLVVARWYSPTWCGVVDGFPHFIDGWVGLSKYMESLPTVQEVPYRFAQWNLKKLWALAEGIERHRDAIDPGSVAAQEVWDSTAAEIQAMADAGLVVVEGVSDLPAYVRDATVAKLDQIVTAYHTGDWDTLGFAFGQFLGENPDLALEPLALVIAGTRIVRQTRGATTAVRDAIELAARTDADEAAALIARTLDEGGDLERLVPNGASLTNAALRQGWGASTVDIVRLKALAAAENIMILFRSRSESAIELLEKGWAWTKPEAFKIKSVDEIDIDYLGYRPAALGRVELVEPPPALRQAIEELVDEVDGNVKAITDQLFEQRIGPHLDQYMTVLRGRHPELASNADLATEVRKRLQTRVEEWPVYDKLLADGTSVDVGFRRRTQGISPGDAGEIAREAGIRRTPVDEVPDVRPDGRPGGGPGPDETRRYWEIELDDVDQLTGESGFRWVTGDIDVVAILDASGAYIRDEAKRVRIYDNLQRLIGMRHGESFTFSPSNYLRSKFLRAHVGPNAPALAAVHASGEVTAARFAENLAITDYANQQFRLPDPTGDFIPLLGTRFQSVVDQGVFSRLVWNPLIANLELAAHYYLPQFWWRFVDGLGEDEQPEPSRDGDAPVVKPDGDGGLLRWTPGGGWEAISVADAVAEGLAGVLDVLPQSAVSEHAPAGSGTIEIGELGSLGDFAPGDVVVIDPGGPNQEIRTVVALGSLVLDRPLDHEHLPGELVSVITPAPACDPSRFNDVGAGHAFCAEITWLASSGITGGYQDGSFGPGSAVSRQAMAAFLYRAAGSPDGPDPACQAGRFNDVGAEHPFCGEITWLADEAITTGYGDGSFGATAAVSRQAMAAFLHRASGSPLGPDPACTTAPFTDVAAEHPYCGEITWLADRGITTGYGDGSFGPSSPVTRQAMAAFLQRHARL